MGGVAVKHCLLGKPEKLFEDLGIGGRCLSSSEGVPGGRLGNACVCVMRISDIYNNGNISLI